MVFGVLQVGGRHVEEIAGNRGIGFGNVSKADALHQPHGRVDDCFGGKPVEAAILEAENIADQVECANLSPSIGQQLVAANRPVDDLIDVSGRFALAEDLAAAVIFELAGIDLGLRQTAEFAEKSRPTAGSGAEIYEHGCPPFFKTRPVSPTYLTRQVFRRRPLSPSLFTPGDIRQTIGSRVIVPRDNTP